MGLYLEGRFNARFFALPVWGLIFGGARRAREIRVSPSRAPFFLAPFRDGPLEITGDRVTVPKNKIPTKETCLKKNPASGDT